MRSRFSASASSISSASPRVPTSEKRLQQVAVGEVLAGGHQLALVLGAALGVQAPPGGVDLQERVLDEVTGAHAAGLSQQTRRGSAPPVARAPGSWIELRCARRAALAVLVDVPGWGHPPHRGACPRADRRGPRGAHPRAVRSRRRALARACTAAPARSAIRRPTASSRSGARSAFPPTARSPTWRSRRTPSSRCAASCARAATTSLHIHEPVVPMLGWDALLLGRRAAARRHVPHLLGEPDHQRRHRRRARRPAGA